MSARRAHGIWTIQLGGSRTQLLASLPLLFLLFWFLRLFLELDPRELKASAVINCGGLFGDDVEKLLTMKDPPFAVRPRKGYFPFPFSRPLFLLLFHSLSPTL